MTTFKLQHPQDLISRLFILEYLRDLGVNTVITKLSEGEKKFWTYKFESEDGEEYDFNWEYLLFVIPITNLSHIMERYLQEIELLELSKKPLMDKKREELLQEQISAPVEINLMDYAKADMERSKNKLIL